MRMCICVSITQNKRQETVIKALGKLDFDRKKLLVDFWGAGSNRYIDYLKSIAESYNLLDAISFKGYSNKINSILDDYDIGINPSLNEGFGRTTIEYMAAGLITIGHSSGATPEIINNGINGFLFDEEQDLTALFQRIIPNLDSMRDIAAYSGRWVKETMDMRVNIKKIYALYQELIRDR